MDYYATMGTACCAPETAEALFRAGMTGCRLNLSHTTLKKSEELIGTFRAAAQRCGVPMRLVADLQGPEQRIGSLTAPIPLRAGEEILLGARGVPAPQSVLAASEGGDTLLLDDSAIALTVRSREAGALRCRVERGGTLQGRKSIAVAGRENDAPPLTEQDRENLALAPRFGVTDVLQPFVRSRADVEAVREVLARSGAPDVRVMAKIENRRGLDALTEIIDAADEICIARGDLGSAIGLCAVPRAQKEIARACHAAGKPFCVATELLWSMHRRAVPTRAEVSDIYNAVLDGAAGLMLTGETAVGEYPVEAMRWLVRAAQG